MNIIIQQNYCCSRNHYFKKSACGVSLEHMALMHKLPYFRPQSLVIFNCEDVIDSSFTAKVDCLICSTVSLIFFLLMRYFGSYLVA